MTTLGATPAAGIAPAASEESRRDLAGPRLAVGAPALIARPFFLAAMVITLTAGAAWGVMLLWRIGAAGSFTGVTVHEINAHGHAQIMGWVGLFIMGFAYQALPRLWGASLPAPRLAFVAFAAALAAIALRSSATYFHAASWAADAQLAGTIIQFEAVALFAWQIALAFRRSPERFTPSTAFIFAAIAFMLAQTVFGGWHAARLIAAPDRAALLNQLATYQAPLRDVQIYGMAMLMIFGVALRLFPKLFGLPQVPARRAWIAFGLLTTAVILEVVFFLAYRASGSRAAAGMLLVPWLMLPAGAALIVTRWRPWRRLPAPATTDRSAKFIRIAFFWLAVSFTLLLMMPVYQILYDGAFSHAYHGAIRHAITVGFISMTIMGMAARVIPRLTGLDAGALPGLWPPFLLVNIGCALRVTLQIATDWWPGVFPLVGISGTLELGGLVWWGLPLMWALITARGQPGPRLGVAAPPCHRPAGRHSSG